MMKKILFIITSFILAYNCNSQIIGVIASSQAADEEEESHTGYYINGEGSDEGNGSYASPWLTLSHLQDKIDDSTIESGDSIYFNGGDTFVGDLDFSGLDSINLSSYGSSNGIISGLTDMSGSWSNYSGNIYRKVITASDVKYLFINNVQYQKGREPDFGTYAKADAGCSTTEIIDADFLDQADDYWNGSEVVIRINAYWYNVRTVSDFDQLNNKLTVSVAMTFAPIEGYGFFMQNSKVCLDVAGEWYFSGDSIYLYWLGDPSSETILAGNYENGITFDGDFCKVEGLTIKGYYGSGIENLTQSRLLTIRDDTIKYCTVGINLQNNDNYYIDSNVIENIGDWGIYTYTSDTGRITDNVVEKAGIYPGYGDNGLQAIYSFNSDSILVYRNDVDSVGYNGIHCSWTKRLYVEDNRVRHYCYLADDGGGIYSYQNDTINVSGYVGTRWRNNFVDYGTDMTEVLSSMSDGYVDVMGFYVDGSGHYFQIDSNLSVHNRYNLWLQSMAKSTIRDNYTTKAFSVSGASGSELATRHSADSMRYCSIIYNNFVTNWDTTLTPATVWMADVYRRKNCTFDYNTYSQPTGQYGVYEYYTFGNDNDTWRTMAEWIAADGGANEAVGTFYWNSSMTNTPKQDYVTYDYNFSNTARQYDFEEGWTYYELDGTETSDYELAPYKGAILYRINDLDVP